MKHLRMFTLRYDQRPITLNGERTRHWSHRAKTTKEWREAFAWLAKVERIPPLGAIEVVVVPHLRDGRSQDPVACVPSFKAALDGLVDAHVIEDDSSRFVHRVTFSRPVHDGRDCMILVVQELA